MEPRLGVFENDGRTIHYAEMGDPDAPLLLCLHGFPEYWAAWQEIMPRLAADFHVVAPDQRGFNRSFKPDMVEDYQTRYLVQDLGHIADHFSPDRPFALAGHDWGASVAYAFAFRRPDRLTHLVIVNGVHPFCFQKAIVEDAGQRRASQYMNRLRAPDADELMSADDFARTLNMIAGFSQSDWMTPETAEAYRAAWREKGALTAMLNWYRASPIVVPEPDETDVDAPLLDLPADALAVRVPHLVVWGEKDVALTPACLEGLDRFAADLTVRRVSDAGHWVLHERPDAVAEAMHTFLRGS